MHVHIDHEIKVNHIKIPYFDHQTCQVRAQCDGKLRFDVRSLLHVDNFTHTNHVQQKSTFLFV